VLVLLHIYCICDGCGHRKDERNSVGRWLNFPRFLSRQHRPASSEAKTIKIPTQHSELEGYMHI
jgi:hypothetical protein